MAPSNLFPTISVKRHPIQQIIMARAIPKQTRTPADELRDLLDASYKTAVDSPSAPPDALLDMLYALDRIQELFPTLEAQGVDLRPERTRWQEVQGAVRRHEADILAGLRGLGGLKRLREALPQPPDPQIRWWWWMDKRRAAAKRKRLLVTLAALAGIILLIAGGVFAFQKLFPVDENVSAAYDHKLKAEDFVLQGDLAAALTELEAAHNYTPDDPDILSLLAALYDLTGQSQQAADVIAQFSARYPPGIVHSNLAQSYLAAGAVDKALALALQAIDEDPANPQGYLMAGMAYEAQGDVRQAMDMYQTAADKANAAKDYQTEAFAKVRLANLLQKPQRTPSP